MASMNGGQRLTVSCSRESTALNACDGMALTQLGRPCAAGTGGGKSPSSSFGHRNVSVIRFSCWDVTSTDYCIFECALYLDGLLLGILKIRRSPVRGR